MMRDDLPREEPAGASPPKPENPDDRRHADESAGGALNEAQREFARLLGRLIAEKLFREGSS